LGGNVNTELPDKQKRDVPFAAVTCSMWTNPCHAPHPNVPF